MINCNTSEDMTRDICTSANSYARPDTKINCVTPNTGPFTIEGFYDEVMAVQGLMEQILLSEKEGDADAYIIACFCDTGLYAARELTEKPVVGIAEASMVLASFIAGRFSIVSVQPRIRMMLEELARRIGLEHRLASIRNICFKVADTHDSVKAFEKAMIEEAKDTIEKDGAETIILGCSGAGPIAEALREVTGIPVIDPVAAAVKIAESLVDMKLNTSKLSSYMYPEKKTFKGFPDIFQP